MQMQLCTKTLVKLIGGQCEFLTAVAQTISNYQMDQIKNDLLLSDATPTDLDLLNKKPHWELIMQCFVSTNLNRYLDEQEKEDRRERRYALFSKRRG